MLLYEFSHFLVNFLFFHLTLLIILVQFDKVELFLVFL